jgi:hypothetical protein
MGFETFDERHKVNKAYAFALADGTTAITMLTADQDGARIDAITAFNSAASIFNLVVTLTQGGTTVVLGVCPVPASAGQGSVAVVDVLPVVTGAAIGLLTMQPGDILKIGMLASLTGTDHVDVYVQGAQF